MSGMPVAVPQWLPNGSSILETSVIGERVVQITANAVRLQQVMDALAGELGRRYRDGEADVAALLADEGRH